MNNIPHFDFGGSQPPLHFLHANGYPPECYQPLFALLQPHYRLFGMKLRPLWDEAKLEDVKDWQIFSDDLLRFLTTLTSEPVIGVGHSVGATVTLRAALREPQKFRALVLLDPVLFVPSFILLWKLLYALGLGKKVHPKAASSLKRRRSFDNLEILFRGYRMREVFKYVNDTNLKSYIAGITKQKADGSYELAFSPEWETHIYLTGLHDLDIWQALPKLEIPTLILRGAESDTFSAKAEARMKKKNPKLQFITLEKASHIFPLEYPQAVSESIHRFIKEIP